MITNGQTNDLINKMNKDNAYIYIYASRHKIRKIIVNYGEGRREKGEARRKDIMKINTFVLFLTLTSVEKRRRRNLD